MVELIKGDTVTKRVVVVGGGQAGASIAQKLRSLGHAGPIAIYGDEPYPPYQRPPLSKKLLAGEWDESRLELRAPSVWRDLEVDVATGVRVGDLDVAGQTIRVDGDTVRWDLLALATGAGPRPRPPGFAGLAGVHDLRDMSDALALRETLRSASRLLVIGGGFVGLETAAVAARLGVAAVVVERAPRILERAVGPEVSAHLRALHARNGVEILENAAVEAVHGTDRIVGVGLADGRTVACDAALVGIGVLPRDDLARTAGLATDDGILVDEFGRTSAPNVWAAGDCARFPLGGRMTRLESVQNATDQGEAVAIDMLGRGAPYRPTPWFWSDQYETKLQIAGLARDTTRTVETRAGEGRAYWRFRGETLVAVEALDDGRAFMTARRLLERGTPIDADALSRGDVDLRTLLR